MSRSPSPLPSNRQSPFNFLRIHSSSKPNEDHYSTTLPSGSRTFLVGGRRFIVRYCISSAPFACLSSVCCHQLPKAILARNSEIFLEIGPNVGSTEVTMLDDRAEAFEDFVDVLLEYVIPCIEGIHDLLLSFPKPVHVLPTSAFSFATKGSACSSDLEQVLLRYHRGTRASSGNSDDYRGEYKVACWSSPFGSGRIPHRR